MDMSKYKSLFVSDTADHLNVLEQNIVELEKKPDDIEIIHEVFRHLHSVKGMSSSMGYGEMAGLAHRLEDLIDIHRENRSAICDQEVDVLLCGLDTLRKQLKEIEQDQDLTPPDKQLLERIQEILNGPPLPPVGGGVGDQHHRDQEKPKVEKPILGYQLQAVVPEDCDVPALRAFLAVKRLSEIGEITRAEPNLTELVAGRFGGERIQIWLATDRGLEDVKKRLDTLSGLDGWSIQCVDENHVKTTTDRTEGSPNISSRSGIEGAVVKQVEIGTVRISTDLLDFFVDSVGELITLRSYLEELSGPLDSPALNEGVRRLNQVVRKLQNRVMEVRMVPVSLLTQRIPRVCRDLARRQEKKVKVHIEGTEVKLDRILVEALDTPVLHILRNAIDHGIENPETRLSAGKPAEGNIRLMVRRESDRVIMTISDDGQGIDTDKVLERAEQDRQKLLGTLGPDGSSAVNLIFQPGFSTRDDVSEVSGRGVGLDSVRKSILSIGGNVTVSSEPGKGTSFTLDLPLTLAIIHVLLVEIEEYLLAIPASRILRVAKTDPDRIKETDGYWSIQLGGKWYPLVDLLALLEERPAPTSFRPDSEIVLAGEMDRPVLALAIGRIAGHREVVLKSVGLIVKSMGPFGGSAVLGDGRPILVLDLDEVFKLTRFVQKGSQP